MIATAKKFGDGDEQPSRSPMDDELAEWKDKFIQLALEARDAGFSTFFALAGHDPFEGEDHYGYAFKGSFCMALGAARASIAMMEQP